MPVLTWPTFHHKTREFINPLVSEESLKDMLTFLHDMGEVSIILSVMYTMWFSSCIVVYTV